MLLIEQLGTIFDRYVLIDRYLATITRCKSSVQKNGKVLL